MTKNWMNVFKTKRMRYKEIRHAVERAKAAAESYGEKHGGFNRHAFISYHEEIMLLANRLYSKFLDQRLAKLPKEDRERIIDQAEYYAMGLREHMEYKIAMLEQELSSTKEALAAARQQIQDLSAQQESSEASSESVS